MENKSAEKDSAKKGMLEGFFDFKSMQKEFPKAAAVVVGIVGGRFVNGLLDKIIMTKTIEGLFGIEIQANIAKWLKPTLVGFMGFGLMSYGKKTGSSLMENIGLGVAGYGISNVFSAITAKNLLSGLGAENEEFVMIDVSGNPIGNIDMRALLPDLETPEYAGLDEFEDEYAGLDEFEELPAILNGDEFEELPQIMN